MNAIIYKELRELAPWALLSLIGIVISTTAVLQESFYLRRVNNVFTEEFFLQMVVAPSIVALILGFAQTIPELWRDHWAFLVQRGVSMKQIFFSKVIAAAIVYGLVVSTAVLIVVICCRWNGIDRYPFEWQMLLAPIAASIGAFGFYFVAMQCVLRQAGHYVTRFLPLILPGLLLCGIVLVFAEVDQFGTPSSWIILMVSTVLFGLMAWGSFVSHGDMKRTPGIARLAIGVPTYAAFVAGYFAFWLSVVVVVDVLQDESEVELLHFLTERTQWNSLHVAENGDVYRSRTTRDTDDSRVVEHALDVDQPQFVSTTSANSVKQLGGATVPPSSSLWGYWRGGHGVDILEHVSSGGNSRRLYSETHGVILNYADPHDVTYPERPRQERFRREPAQLVSVVTPDGFQSASEFQGLTADSPHRFGKLIGVLGSWRGHAGRVIDRRGGRGGPVTDVRTVLLFDDGLFEINFESESVTLHFEPPPGKLIRSLFPLGEAEVLAVFTDDSLSRYSAQPILFDTYPDNRPGTDEDVTSTTTVLMPDKLHGSTMVPAEVQTLLGFTFGVTDNEYIYHSYGSFLSLDIDRVVKTDHSGRVIEVRTIAHSLPALPLPVCLTLGITAGIAPAGPVAVVRLVDVASQSISGFGPGIIGRTLLRSPTRTAVVLLVQLLSAWFSVWLAGRFAMRRGMSAVARRRWQWISLLLGPAAALTLASLHAQPVMTVCGGCQRKRVIDNDDCEYCGAAQQPPATDGTEIFGTLTRATGSSGSAAKAELAV